MEACIIGIMSSDFSFSFFRGFPSAFGVWSLVELEVSARMSSEIIKSEDAISCDKPKLCNKFSIENILGLNDAKSVAKVNRLELIDLSRKGEREREERVVE